MWIYEIYCAISAVFFSGTLKETIARTTRKVLHFLYVETKAGDSPVLSR